MQRGTPRRGRHRALLIVSLFGALFVLAMCRGAHGNYVRGTNPRQAEALGRTAASTTLAPRPAVVGGTDAPQERLTHQVALAWDAGWGLRLYCGGSLIREDVVLSAAHCDPWMSDVLVPGTYTNQDGPAGADWAANGMRPRLIMKHPSWDPNTMAGDAALVFLDGCAQLGPATTTIKLATASEFAAAAAANADFVMSGWGTTSLGAGSSGGGGATPVGGRLQYGITKYVDTPSCTLISGDPTSVSSYMFCAGTVPAMGSDVTPPYQDTCQGDSGGPIFFNLDGPTNVLAANKTLDRLAGITSWGQGCGMANLPGVYTRVPSVLSWIQEQLAAHPRACNGPPPPNDSGNDDPPPQPPQQPPPDWPPQWPPFFDPNPQLPPPPPPSPPTTGDGNGGGLPDPGGGGYGSGGGTDAQQPSDPQCASAEEAGADEANWYGKPKFLLLRGENADADVAPDACCDACLSRPACVAYSVAVKVAAGKERRSCAFYTVAERLCGAADRVAVCKRASEGSYVIVARRRKATTTGGGR